MALNSLINLFKIHDLKNKILFSIAMIILYRFGSHIPIPGVNHAEISRAFSHGQGLLGFLDLFSGGALARFSIFGLGIIPYINASIIMQLLTAVFPQLKELAHEGESGRKQIAQWTRYFTVVLAVFQASSVPFFLRQFILPGYNFSFFVVSTVISLVAGSIFVMWIGELITERGIGNGASLLIFVGIVGRLPLYFAKTVTIVQGGANVFGLIILISVFLLVILGIIIVQESHRRIPVQYAKRIVGRKVYGGQNTFIPLRINQGGVLPIIFASSVLQFPLMLQGVIPLTAVKVFIERFFNYDSIFYNLLFFALIFFFTYFYTAITFDPNELSNNIKKYGGFILGVRPGRPTSEYLEKIITRLTLIGALFLSVIAIVPVFTANATRITSFMGLGGTALLIVVGVSLDLIRQIETHLLTRQYEGVIS